MRRDVGRGRVARALLLGTAAAGLLALFVGRSQKGAAPGSPAAALTSAGVRLSYRYSASELTRAATRGDVLLPLLTSAEREGLTRGWLRFRLDEPSVVVVAAPRGFEPFWLAEQGFEPTSESLQAGSAPREWSISRRRFAPGWVDLGVTGLDRRTPAHYVVLVRSEDGRSTVPTSIEGEAGWRTAEAREGASLAGGVDLPILRLPESLRGSTLLRPAHDRRHAALLASGRVWKTHVVSREAPDQITVSFGADAARELVWSWRTEPGRLKSVVRYRRVGAGGSPAVVEGTASTVTVRELINDPAVLRHSASVSGLEPDTPYEYSVGDNTPEGTSPWYQVRTGPSQGTGVHFLYMGDPQCGLEGWGTLLAAARRRHPEAEALLVAGDLVDRGNERSNWDHFFLRAAGVFEVTPLMPAVGNHEYLDRGPRLYQSFFRLPPNGPAGTEPGLVYRFEIGDAFVAVLDSTLAVSSPAEARRQAEWVDAELAATGRRWKIVMFHHPLYASHTERENLPLREAWAPVFDRRGVDLVLQGHDHAYLRTYPMLGGRRISDGGRGTVYVVSVSGDKFYDQDPREYAESAFTHVSTYQTIDTDSTRGTLRYRAWNLEGKVLDEFTLNQREQTPALASEDQSERR